ncbi:reverse transcriptase domain-containing protein [Williamwhitmania taraxaci]|nr:reverse transcriptase domain-containing protein [Williamwhitmania taraxaci]
MKPNKDWFKPKGYLHLDDKITFDQRNLIQRKVSNVSFVGNHAFLPLLYKTVTQRKYKKIKQPNGIVRRSHTEIKNGKVIPTKKVRPIMYASHLDAQIYAYYANKVLGEKYEKLLKQTHALSNCICAYRKIPSDDGTKKKNNISFAHDAFQEIKRRGECAAIALDIESFFSSLDHVVLKHQWCQLLGKSILPKDHYNIFKSITRFHYININDFKTTHNGFDEAHIAELRKKGIHSFLESPKELQELIRTKQILVHKNQFVRKKEAVNVLVGIPQGLAISAMLANIYMYAFDKMIYEELVLKRGVFYRRYSDDIVLVCETDERNEVLSFVMDAIRGKETQLTISEKKTEVSTFKKEFVGKEERLQVYREETGTPRYNVPFVYLGFEFYGYQTLIKSANLAKYYRRLKDSIRRASRRADRKKERDLSDEKILFKTKLFRQLTFKGRKTRMLKIKRSKRIKDMFGNWQYIVEESPRKYRGNVFRYVYNAANEMNAPEIKRQYRNHWSIMEKTVNAYNFVNTKLNQEKKTS